MDSVHAPFFERADWGEGSPGVRCLRSGSRVRSPSFPRMANSLPFRCGSTKNRKSGGAVPSSLPGGENAMSRLVESPSEKPSASLTTREVTRDATAPAAEFSPEQRRILLRIAHGAILSALERRPFPEAPPVSPGLSAPRGAFTTLYLHNEVHR